MVQANRIELQGEQAMAIDHPARTEGSHMASMVSGALANVPLAVSAAIYGGVLGVLSAQRGVSWAEMLAMNVFMFAGSAQFVMVDMWQPPLSVAAVAAAVFAINLRYLLIGASLQPLFKEEPLWRKALFMHVVVDENWAVTMARHRSSGTDPWFLLGGGLLLLAAWCAATLGGNLLGNVVQEPERYGLDFAFIAVFTALALSLWRGSRTDLLPWGVAAVLAVLAAQLLPGKWHIVIGGTGGGLAAALATASRNRASAGPRKP